MNTINNYGFPTDMIKKLFKNIVPTKQSVKSQVSNGSRHLDIQVCNQNQGWSVLCCTENTQVYLKKGAIQDPKEILISYDDLGDLTKARQEPAIRSIPKLDWASRWYTLAFDPFYSVLESSSLSMSCEESRFCLNGICINKDAWYASDGHRA